MRAEGREVGIIVTFFGSDHRGFKLKEALKAHLAERGIQVEDLGNAVEDPDDDYVDFAAKVAAKVSENPSDHRGILICGSGHGVDMVANKFKGVKSALAFNEAVAKQSREHEDANVLSLASDWVSEEDAKKIVDVWLATPFSGEERHVRRLEKIKVLEVQP
ncbi:RpiB/LacA/LacB family sugar-phosphate isomerase [Candidatus Parcubacteria bacterium]|nr:RpiB/LacA/LacB family sugar-phosphate isomerase [Candidatus Parcubacteria bacterium]MBI4385409.1 RpiB/LacA/LacB family sugar-phosphate isomerase [Candidatus Parcubacteria bacterium]